MVICFYCKSSMIAQTPLSGRKSEKVKILSYRCDNPNCPRRDEKLKLAKSIRAKVVFDHMADTLSHLSVGETEYNKILARLSAANEAKQQRLAVEVHSKQAALKDVKRDVEERSLKIINIDKSSPIYSVNENHINELESRRLQLEDEIAKLEQKRSTPKTDLISFQDFLNVANNASQLLKAADVAAKDRIARLIYLNVEVDDEKVVNQQIREPFKTLLENQNILLGRGDRG
jgi:hypothetical protein